MTEEAITTEKINELLAFLPRFDTPQPEEPVKRWAGGEQSESGAVTIPYPVYSAEAAHFFDLAGQPCWADYNYKPVEAAQMIQDDAFIAQATLADIKTMLTFCVRGERFSEGHWAAMLKTGRITAILKRLQALRDTVS